MTYTDSMSRHVSVRNSMAQQSIESNDCFYMLGAKHGALKCGLRCVLSETISQFFQLSLIRN
jgi:hypothetical protein